MAKNNIDMAKTKHWSGLPKNNKQEKIKMKIK